MAAGVVRHPNAEVASAPGPGHARRDRYEAVYMGPGTPPEIYKAGTADLVQLPEKVTKETARRFAEIHAQDPYTQELYLMEAKPCTI